MLEQIVGEHMVTVGKCRHVTAATKAFAGAADIRTRALLFV